MYSRDNDYEHYVKCPCGWEGWSAWMRHGYIAYGHGEEADVEAMDFCPKCNTSEEFAEMFLTCHGNCSICPDRYLCYTLLNNIPIKVKKEVDCG